MKVKKETIRLLLETAPSIEIADKIIVDNYGFKTVPEKIAFLKGMFDFEVFHINDDISETKDTSDETTYFAILKTILF